MNNIVNFKSRIKPIQKKTNTAQYTLYIEVRLYFNGLNVDNVRVSTGITIEKSRWDNGRVKGRDISANNANDVITGYLTTTNDLISEIKVKRITTLNDIKAELQNNLSQRITGRATRGQKTEYVSRLKEYSYDYVLTHKLKNKPVSKERERQYWLHLNLIKEYFNNEVPPINQFTKTEVDRIKKWLAHRYPNTNTLATRLSYFAAILKYAHEVLEILPTSPIPKNFYGTFCRGNRDILTEAEQMNLLTLRDSTLTLTEQKAKYSLGLSLLTGIGFGDLKAMEYHHIKENQYGIYIEKARNKTDIPFKIFLSENAASMLKELIRLTGNDTKPFNLASLDYINRMYKRLAKKAGITKNVTSYVCRHTFAVNYMENGGKIEDLQVILGHANILITSKVYGRISDKRLAQAMKQQAVSPIHQLPPKLMAV